MFAKLKSIYKKHKNNPKSLVAGPFRDSTLFFAFLGLFYLFLNERLTISCTKLADSNGKISLPGFDISIISCGFLEENNLLWFVYFIVSWIVISTISILVYLFQHTDTNDAIENIDISVEHLGRDLIFTRKMIRDMRNPSSSILFALTTTLDRIKDQNQTGSEGPNFLISTDSSLYNSVEDSSPTGIDWNAFVYSRIQKQWCNQLDPDSFYNFPDDQKHAEFDGMLEAALSKIVNKSKSNYGVLCDKLGIPDTFNKNSSDIVGVRVWWSDPSSIEKWFGGNADDRTLKKMAIQTHFNDGDNGYSIFDILVPGSIKKNIISSLNYDSMPKIVDSNYRDRHKKKIEYIQKAISVDEWSVETDMFAAGTHYGYLGDNDFPEATIPPFDHAFPLSFYVGIAILNNIADRVDVIYPFRETMFELADRTSELNSAWAHFKSAFGVDLS